MLNIPLEAPWHFVHANGCGESVPAMRRPGARWQGSDGRPAVSLEALPGGHATWDYAYDMAADGSIGITLRAQSAEAVGPAREGEPQAEASRGSSMSCPSQLPHVSQGRRRPGRAAVCTSHMDESDPSWLSSQL